MLRSVLRRSGGRFFLRGLGGGIGGSLGGSSSGWGRGGLAASVAGVVAAAATGVAMAGGVGSESSGSEPVGWAVDRPVVLFVLGGPGAGKGTQSGRLAAEFGFVHLSAGDLLRAERDSGSPDGEMINAYIKEGKIVPVEVTVTLLEKAMRESGASRFVIDGFPRNVDNLQGWQRAMEHKARVEFVLFFDADDEVMLQRVLARAKTSGRVDDNEATMRKRFRVFREQTMPVVQSFQAQGRVRTVPADDPVEVVFQAASQAVLPVVQQQVLRATHNLLSAIDTNNKARYDALTHPSLSAIEEESLGERVVGRDFHHFYFPPQAKGGKEEVEGSGKKGVEGGKAGIGPECTSRILHPEVRILGPHAALVSYTRVVQRRAGPSVAFAESRVWMEEPGQGWRNVHLHRSRIGGSAPAVTPRSLHAASKEAEHLFQSSVESLLSTLRRAEDIARAATGEREE